MPEGWWGEVKRSPPKRPSTKPCPELRRQRFRHLVQYLKTLERLEKVAVERTHPDDVDRAYVASGWKSLQGGGAGGSGDAEGTTTNTTPTQDQCQNPLVTAGSGRTNSATKDQHGEINTEDLATDKDATKTQGHHHGPQADDDPSRAAPQPEHSPEAFAGEADHDDSTRPSSPECERTESALSSPSTQPSTAEHEAAPAGPAAAPVHAPATRYNVSAAALTKFLRHKAGIECCWSRADYNIMEWKKHEGTQDRWNRVSEMQRKISARGRAGSRCFDPTELSIKKRTPGPSRLCDGWTPDDLAWEDAQEEAYLKNSWWWRRETCGRRVHRL